MSTHIAPDPGGVDVASVVAAEVGVSRRRSAVMATEGAEFPALAHTALTTALSTPLSASTAPWLLSAPGVRGFGGDGSCGGGVAARRAFRAPKDPLDALRDAEALDAALGAVMPCREDGDGDGDARKAASALTVNGGQSVGNDAGGNDAGGHLEKSEDQGSRSVEALGGLAAESAAWRVRASRRRYCGIRGGKQDAHIPNEALKPIAAGLWKLIRDEVAASDSSRSIAHAVAREAVLFVRLLDAGIVPLVWGTGPTLSDAEMVPSVTMLANKEGAVYRQLMQQSLQHIRCVLGLELVHWTDSLSTVATAAIEAATLPILSRTSRTTRQRSERGLFVVDSVHDAALRFDELLDDTVTALHKSYRRLKRQQGAKAFYTIQASRPTAESKVSPAWVTAQTEHALGVPLSEYTARVWQLWKGCDDAMPPPPKRGRRQYAGKRPT